MDNLMGGHAFEQGSSSIMRDEVRPTLDSFFAEVLIPIGVEKFVPIGSTGKKSASNDIDLAIGPIPEDEDVISYKKYLLSSIVSILGSENAKLVGQNIAVNYPIESGDPDRQDLRVQIDLMLSKNPDATAWLMSGTGDEKVKGVFRNLLLSYIAKLRSEEQPGTKITISYPGGIQVVKDGQTVVPRTEDPEEILSILEIDGNPEDLSDFESLLDVVQGQGKFNLDGFEAYMASYLKRDPEQAQRALDVFKSKKLIRESIRAILRLL